jgi:hypothetical protein
MGVPVALPPKNRVSLLKLNQLALMGKFGYFN